MRIRNFLDSLAGFFGIRFFRVKRYEGFPADSTGYLDVYDRALKQCIAAEKVRLTEEA